MNTTTRLAAIGASGVLASGAALAGASPAQAIGGCSSNTVCVFPAPDFGGIPHRISIPVLRSKGTINFYGSDDNSANGAINNSASTIILCQYHNLRGYCWAVGANSAYEWTGDRSKWDRASSTRIAG